MNNSLVPFKSRVSAHLPTVELSVSAPMAAVQSLCEYLVYTVRHDARLWLFVVLSLEFAVYYNHRFVDWAIYHVGILHGNDRVPGTNTRVFDDGQVGLVSVLREPPPSEARKWVKADLVMCEEGERGKPVPVVRREFTNEGMLVVWQACAREVIDKCPGDEFAVLRGANDFLTASSMVVVPGDTLKSGKLGFAVMDDARFAAIPGGLTAHRQGPAVYLPSFGVIAVEHVDKYSRSLNGLTVLREAILAQSAIVSGESVSLADAYELEFAAFGMLGDVVVGEEVSDIALTIAPDTVFDDEQMISVPDRATFQDGRFKGYPRRLEWTALGAALSTDEEDERSRLLYDMAVSRLIDQHLPVEAARAAKVRFLNGET